MDAGYHVKFEGRFAGAGDYDSFRFLWTPAGGENEHVITVQISRNLQKSLRERWGFSDDEFPAVVASGARHHLLRTLPSTTTDAEGASATVSLRRDAYPGYPGRPETVEEWRDFWAERPRARLGFNTPPAPDPED